MEDWNSSFRIASRSSESSHRGYARIQRRILFFRTRPPVPVEMYFSEPSLWY